MVISASISCLRKTSQCNMKISSKYMCIYLLFWYMYIIVNYFGQGHWLWAQATITIFVHRIPTAGGPGACRVSSKVGGRTGPSFASHVKCWAVHVTVVVVSGTKSYGYAMVSDGYICFSTWSLAKKWVSETSSITIRCIHGVVSQNRGVPNQFQY